MAPTSVAFAAAAVCAALLCPPASATSASTEFHEVAKKVNAKQSSWKAAPPRRFNSTGDVKKVCGTWLPGHPRYAQPPPVRHIEKPKSGIPESWDARTQWANCTVMLKVQDQSACGSCWAFAAAQAFQDRQCLYRVLDVEMSAEDTATCCSGFECGFSQGCSGGQPSTALQWMTTVGVVTGGAYGDPSLCMPYAFPPCTHHDAVPSSYPQCSEADYPTPQCNRTCSEGYPRQYSDDKHRGGTVYSVSGVDSIMAALLQGPLVAVFRVFSDFPTYTSGVYRYTSGDFLGGHAVELIGFGTEGGDDYWLVKNSWNGEWGDQGFFKILRGVNECGIEDSVVAIDF
eukprot:TRINITY_DN19334_c0_g1_i1.p1 TRINITY_DN19334_c0_g1~~TRINITY_DN19334_c0_g1_i1.p1  ORF type:complete len:342 (+),score=99.86 TRINITY_DN19334_c0_g1_i1:126-1151(+)